MHQPPPCTHLQPRLTSAAPSVSAVPSRTLACVLHPCAGLAACRCLTSVRAIVAWVHQGVLGIICGQRWVLPGGKGLGDTASRERPFPFLSAIGITTAPQHSHPTQGPVAVSPSATATAVPTSMPGVIQLGKNQQNITYFGWFWVKRAGCHFESRQETAASPGEGWYPGVGAGWG